MATTSAERMRWKRARDRGMVWGEGDESQLSDTALIEQLAIACQKAREGQGNAIALGLLREIAARIGLSGRGPLRKRNLKHVKLLRRAAAADIRSI